ncbi:ester cyclase [Massilia sp. RP-1-19]|uniref:Ester cyclase n=1 Tax=Massilia polaris TaxID=2728846 RepID=A0A848HVY3_9BURK|nr:ester cyclase [Massilia polaris]
MSDGNMVVVRSAITGTHRGFFMGHGGTGRKLSIQAVDIHEVRNGKIAQTWHTEDWMTGLLQLGLLPDKAP